MVMISVPFCDRLIYMHGSNVVRLNPMLLRRLSSSMFHSLPDCFSPYRVFFSQQTQPVPLLYPSSCSMYTSSFTIPFKYAPYTSICWISQSRIAAVDITDRIVSKQMTGEKVLV